MSAAPIFLAGIAAEAAPFAFLDVSGSVEEARLLDWLTPEREDELVDQIRATLAAARSRLEGYVAGDVWPN